MAKAILDVKRSIDGNKPMTFSSQNLCEIDELKNSADIIGELYPILVDYHGKIIDGKHRFAADPKWVKVKLDHIKTKKDRLIARLISNNARRSVPAKEKTEILHRLAQIFTEEGWEPGNIAYKLAKETGMSYRWVLKYLPDKYKDQIQSKRRADAHYASAKKWLTPIPEGILEVKSFANTEFINVLIRKDFYQRLEKKAEKLGAKPDTLIYNALVYVNNVMRIAKNR
ncbi:MAG: hypothetical protein ACFFDI_02125 [Promethearchaeota archaeon]